jgi:hypothetical protein
MTTSFDAQGDKVQTAMTTSFDAEDDKLQTLMATSSKGQPGRPGFSNRGAIRGRAE